MNGPEPRPGPALAAARRGGGQSTTAQRPYELPLEADLNGDAVVLAATRALLIAHSRQQAATVLRTAIHDLGGAVVPARLAEVHPDALPADVSLGIGEPMLVVVPELSVAALRIGHHLPDLIRDAQQAAERCDVSHRQRDLAARDMLTGVASRQLIDGSLGRARPGDAVCMLDLDGFKALNDTSGHAAGDQALQEFAALLRSSVRPGEFCGRYGGDEFVLVLAATPVPVARERMLEVVALWRDDAWHGTTTSVGIAAVDADGGHSAARRADEALLRAKRSGRNRVELFEEVA